MNNKIKILMGMTVFGLINTSLNVVQNNEISVPQEQLYFDSQDSSQQCLKFSRIESGVKASEKTYAFRAQFKLYYNTDRSVLITRSKGVLLEAQLALIEAMKHLENNSQAGQVKGSIQALRYRDYEYLTIEVSSQNSSTIDALGLHLKAWTNDLFKSWNSAKGYQLNPFEQQLGRLDTAVNFFSCTTFHQKFEMTSNKLLILSTCEAKG